MARRRVIAAITAKSQTKKMTKKNLKKKLSSDLLIQQHAELVKVLCDNRHFRRLICRLTKKNNNSSLSMALVDASHHISNEDTHVPCRRVFSQSQLTQLEIEFAYNRYLSRMRRKSLAGELSIDELTVQSWFQRRRQKQKHQQRVAPILPVLQHLGPLNLLQAIAG